MRLVIDPAVLAAALVTPSGAPARLLDFVRQRQVDLAVSPHLLDELTAVLHREPFRSLVTPEEVDQVATGLRQLATVHDDPDGTESITRNADDDYLVRLAQASEADFLVSGDKDVLVAASWIEDVFIVDPRRMSEIIDPDG